LVAPSSAHDLVEVLVKNRERILASWIQGVRGRSDSPYAGSRVDLVARWGADLLDAIIDSLRTGTERPIDTHTDGLAYQRLEQGFEIEQVISSILILREACIPPLQGDTRTSGQEPRQVHELLDVSIRRTVTRFAARYSRIARESLEEERRRMEVLLEIAEAASGAADLSAVLQRTVDALAPVIGATECAAYAPDPEESGLRICAMTRGPDPQRNRLFRSRLAADGPLVQGALEARQPTILAAADTVAGCLHSEARRDPAEVIVVFPLMSQDEVQAIILAAMPPLSSDLPTDQIDLAWGIVNTVVPAVQSARLHEQHERTMVTEERQRLARDLHDSVTQSIYGVTMYAEAAARLLDRGDSPGAAEILRELRDTSVKALREMRLLIFELRPTSLSEDGLVTAIESRLGAVEARAGLETTFVYDEIGRFPKALEEGLFGIVREALHNVLKHANASRVSIGLQRSGHALTLEITDDGSGFETEGSWATGGLGLPGMEERALQLGLRLEVTSRPGEGTRVRVEVPLPWRSEN